MTKPVTWHVLGAGAMGCLWAAKLHEQGHDCHLILREQSPTTVPLQLETGAGKQQYALPASDASGLNVPITHLLVATKAGDVKAALASVEASITPRTQIVLLQNGIKVQRQLREADTGNRLYCLSNSHGAWLRGPFHVVHAGFGRAWLGQLQAPWDKQEAIVGRCRELLRALPAAAMRVEVAPLIDARLWEKFAVNCCVNALTVIHNCRNGQLLEPPLRDILIPLCEETGRLVNAVAALPAELPVFERVVEVLQATAENYSSTLQDARQGRRLELEHLNAWLCELADAKGLDCSLNRQVLAQVDAVLDVPEAFT